MPFITHKGDKPILPGHGKWRVLGRPPSKILKAVACNMFQPEPGSPFERRSLVRHLKLAKTCLTLANPTGEEDDGRGQGPECEEPVQAQAEPGLGPGMGRSQGEVGAPWPSLEVFTEVLAF